MLESENKEKDLKIEQQKSYITDLQEDHQALKKKYALCENDIIRLQTDLETCKKKLKQFEDQKRDLEELNDQWERSARILEYSKQELEERLNQAEETAILYKEEIEELSVTNDIEIQRLKDQYNDLRQELSVLEIEKTQKSEEGNSPKKHSVEIVRIAEGISIPSHPASRTPSKNASRNASRGHSRRNSTDSNDGSQSVKVVIRVRPPLNEEIWDKNLLQINSNTIQIREKSKLSAEPRIFDFESIVSPDQTEEEMFAEILDCVDQVFDGKNACVMAYGQTGSGKTHTMNSIISKSLERLKDLENAEVSVQCIEVYNETVKNLIFTEVPSKSNKDSLDVVDLKLGSDWTEKALQVISSAISKRTTKFTECNEHSSRSHAIFTLTITTGEGSSKIQFVDLAGSERVGKSKVTGEALKEALLINKSLSALQDVISALENKSKHVPYRNSTLTKLLQPTLGGSKSIVTMIVNCSPSADSLNETVCTLALASRVKAVDLGFIIRKNLKNKEVERTLCLLEKERSEKHSLLRSLDKLQRDLESYQFAVKDRDCKIAMLNNKIKLKDKAYQDVRQPKIEVIKPQETAKVKGKSLITVKMLDTPKGKIKEQKMKNRSLLHLSIKDVGRVVSFSPPMKPLNSPSFGDKPTRIPAPSFINLKFGHSV